MATLLQKDPIKTLNTQSDLSLTSWTNLNFLQFLLGMSVGIVVYSVIYGKKLNWQTKDRELFCYINN